MSTLKSSAAKYLELRYRMLPYLYSAVHECATTGMPIMRALWLHYPDDPKAVARGDEYLWGKNVLVAPVVEKGAATRQVYLPAGGWYDFWTQEHLEGGREISRNVDLETMPLYVRAGSILPLGPVKQFTGEKVEQPLSVSIYPGSDASFLLYEDDGSLLQLSQGRMDGNPNGLARRQPHFDSAPCRWFSHASSAPQEIGAEAGEADAVSGIRGRPA